jgi:hypothetical protein
MHFLYGQTICFIGSPTTYITFVQQPFLFGVGAQTNFINHQKSKHNHGVNFFLNLSGLCVDESAVLPDLAAGRVGDVAHLHHGVGELLEERGGVSPVLVHGVGRRVADHAGPHLLVGVEEALARDEGLVVGVVEDRRRVTVHGADVVVTAVQGADFLELAEVGL